MNGEILWKLVASAMTPYIMTWIHDKHLVDEKCEKNLNLFCDVSMWLCPHIFCVFTSQYTYVLSSDLYKALMTGDCGLDICRTMKPVPSAPVQNA